MSKETRSWHFVPPRWRCRGRDAAPEAGISNPKERHYPTTGITLGLTAVKEERPGRIPLLKLYDSFDPVVVRSARGPNPIAANYFAVSHLVSAVETPG